LFGVLKVVLAGQPIWFQTNSFHATYGREVRTIVDACGGQTRSMISRHWVVGRGRFGLKCDDRLLVRIFTDKNSLDHFRHSQIDFAARPERDDFSSSRHRALGFWWSMIFSENRHPLFGIMLWNSCGIARLATAADDRIDFGVCCRWGKWWRRAVLRPQMFATHY
jgi:hypothetical protein